jgi:hypothetical protein
MLYGLKQSGCKWNRELDQKLHTHGFMRLKADPCVYTRANGGLEIITVWVNNLLLFAMSEELMAKMKENLRTKWEVTDLGKPVKIIGIKITRKERSITISQEHYINTILEKEGMQCANPVAMPMDPNDLLEPNPDGNEGDHSNSYVHALGKLQFLANVTRPDISYAVNRLAVYTANPSLQHTGALKQILCYLKGTKSYGITYSGMPHKNRNTNLFHGYTDVVYTNSDGRHQFQWS